MVCFHGAGFQRLSRFGISEDVGKFAYRGVESRPSKVLDTNGFRSRGWPAEATWLMCLVVSWGWTKWCPLLREVVLPVVPREAAAEVSKRESLERNRSSRFLLPPLALANLLPQLFVTRKFRR